MRGKKPFISQRSNSAKICPLCPQVGLQSLGNFGIATSRKDKRNLYCKKCINEKVSAGRRERRAMRKARKAALGANLPIRKPDVIALKRTPADRVLQVIDHYTEPTQREMVRGTRLTKDQVGDALAELMLDQRLIACRYEPGRGENVYFRRTTVHQTKAA